MKKKPWWISPSIAIYSSSKVDIIIFIWVNLFLKGCLIENGVYICNGNDIYELEVEDGQNECAFQCALTEGCVAWTLRVSDSNCWLKSDSSCKGTEKGWVTGSKACGSTSTYLQILLIS